MPENPLTYTAGIDSTLFIPSNSHHYLENTGFPHYLKLEHCHETFYKQKWRKAKMQLPWIYMENVLSVLRPKFNACTMSLFYSPRSKPFIVSSVILSIEPLALSGLSDTWGRILLTDAQNKMRRSTDAHRHNSELWQLDAETLSIILREGAWQGHSHCCHCPCSGWLLQE